MFRKQSAPNWNGLYLGNNVKFNSRVISDLSHPSKTNALINENRLNLRESSNRNGKSRNDDEQNGSATKERILTRIPTIDSNKINIV